MDWASMDGATHGGERRTGGPDSLPAAVQHPLAVIVVDHGSRRAESNESMEVFVRSSADRLLYPIVEPAHMELAEPSIDTAFDRCVAAGGATVVIAPYFLGPGRHWDRDIPALAAGAAARHPGIGWLVTAPLGPHPLLMDIVDRRVEHCLAHVAGTAGACAACAGTGRCALR
jgi:sirohydrochlorin ferrochelatase